MQMIVVAEKSSGQTVQIDLEISQELNTWLRNEGRIKRTVVTRIIAWFLRQPRSVQNVILGVDAEVGAAYAEVFEAMAEHARQMDSGKVLRSAATESPPRDRHRRMRE